MQTLACALATLTDVTPHRHCSRADQGPAVDIWTQVGELGQQSLM